MRGLLVHCCVKARATLLNVSEVKSGDVRDHLDEICVHEISVSDGNSGAVGNRDCLRKCSAGMWVLRTAVAGKPPCVDIEMHEVGKTADVFRSRRSASLQGAELVKINRLGSLGLEIRIEEGSVAHFIQRVAGYVLGPI